MWCYGITQGFENNAYMSKTPVNIALILSGLKGEDLADRMGISAPHLSRLKTGKSPTTNIHVQKLAEICGVTEQEFYRLMAGDETVSPKASRSVAGVDPDERLMFNSDWMEDALDAARSIDQKYANGRAKTEDFKPLLHAIYRFLEAVKSEKNN
jgi:transcriptional regulator with XRE-family HTH domain